jgi:hypothetical protein
MGVIVLGMHRSGTSALTRVVSLLGLHVGADESLVEATDDNPAGHWEVEALSLFNEDLLLELGGHWSGPPALDRARLVDLAAGDWGGRARKLLDQSFAGRPFVWKDPRLCLLLPFWLEVLDEAPLVVSTFRNPLEVAHSIGRRDGLLPIYTLALWERHQRQALLDSVDLPGYLVDYAQLLADPVQVWSDLDTWFAEQGLERERPATRAEVESFIDTSLHRQQRTDDEFRAEASPEQVALWELLLARAGSPLSLSAADLPPETPGLQLAFDEHNRMSEFRDLALQQRAGIDDLLAQIADQLASIETLQQWLDESRAETAHTWSEIRRLEAEHRELTESKALILDYLETVIAERDELRLRWNKIKALPGVELAIKARQRLLTR